jgi:hypothetical protein
MASSEHDRLHERGGGAEADGRDAGAAGGCGKGPTAVAREVSPGAARYGDVAAVEESGDMTLVECKLRRSLAEMSRLAELVRSIPGAATDCDLREQHDFRMRSTMKPRDVLACDEALPAVKHVIDNATIADAR